MAFSVNTLQDFLYCTNPLKKYMEVCVAKIHKVYAVVVLIKQCLICIFQISLTRVLIFINSFTFNVPNVNPTRKRCFIFIFDYSAQQLDYPLVCFLEF